GDEQRAPLLRDDARRKIPAAGLSGRRADRLRDLPARDHQAAAGLGREALQRPAVDAVPGRRPLRSDGGAGDAGRRRARVLSAAPRLGAGRPLMHRSRAVVLLAVLLGQAGCAVRLPEAGECDRASADHPVCGLQNPEDVVALPGTGWLLASELRRQGDPPGSIIAFTLDGAEAMTVVGPSHPAERLDDPFLAKLAEICPGPLPPDGLAPHGMELVVE